MKECNINIILSKSVIWDRNFCFQIAKIHNCIEAGRKGEAVFLTHETVGVFVSMFTGDKIEDTKEAYEINLTLRAPYTSQNEVLLAYFDFYPWQKACGYEEGVYSFNNFFSEEHSKIQLHHGIGKYIVQAYFRKKNSKEAWVLKDKKILTVDKVV